jgi:signal transduction histidine kinase
MKEVSCRILEMFFRELKRKGLPDALLVEGVGYSLAHVQNKQERIDWSAFGRLMENAQRIWTDDELVAIGGAWIDSPFLRHTRLIAGALFSSSQLYGWFDTTKKEADGKKARKGLGVQMFTCVSNTVTQIDPSHIQLDVVLDEGYATCVPFFLLTKGGYVELPRMVGKGRAAVEMTWIERGARYDVRLPPGADQVSVLRRAAKWISAPMAAARELDETHAALQIRYEELDAARARLAIQAAQLRTAHKVNELIQKHLDLDLTLAAITRALVEEAGFARVQVDLACEVDGVKAVRSHDRGDGGANPVERILEANTGQAMGKLTVFAHAKDDRIEREALLALVVPPIAMALDNAVSYLVVEEYRKGLERRVEERTAELSQARDELAGSVKDLEEAREARERIFANINHDIRSPLSLILLTVAEARRAGALTPKAEKTLSGIEHGARRVLRMVDELLILAEGREGEVRLATALIDLSQMVEAVGEAWKPAAQAANLELSHNVAAGVGVRADPNALERILANLVSNAIKFTPKDGKIRLGLTTAASGWAQIDVQDNGAGIDDELKKRLFGRFERGNLTKRSAIGGSGLGLSLVKELAEAHGGSVVVLDSPGGGALFRVELPTVGGRASLTPKDAQETGAPRAAALRPQDYGVAVAESQTVEIYEPEGKTARATILLAEDDPALREHTARLLAEDYRVIAAPDGMSAFEQAQRHAPDLLITDIAMPRMDGIELTRNFRALPKNRLSPVLVLTTFGGIADKLSGFDAGAVDYIHKPFEPSELRARVKSQLTLRGLALQLLETEKLAALGTLSAGLAHEIRNPANGIINAVGPLRDVLPPEAITPDSPAGQLLDIVESCSQQVAAMSRQLLGFKRGVEPKRQPVAITTLVNRVFTTLSPTLEGIQLRPELEYKGEINCAEPLIAQVLTNLVQNGAHAAGRGGWVEVRTGREKDHVFMEIRDSGPGVPEDLKERIFEPFFTTKPAGSGTGLGLSTARDIALRHGGSLDVRSAGGRSVFRLEIPSPS